MSFSYLGEGSSLSELFADHISSKESYDDLHKFSVTRLNDFWMTVWEFTGVRASVHPQLVRTAL